MNKIQRLLDLGQSAWLDYVDRRLLTSGELGRMVETEGLRGVTSNPTIFEKAVAGSNDYDGFVRSAPPQESDASVFERLMTRDLALACDTLRAVYEITSGSDGFASIEVSPRVAHDCPATIEEALRLWNAVDRANLMVKIPGTRACIPAVHSCLKHGININITLLFSVSRYREILEAYMTALEARLAAKEPIDRIASVASFFVSRVDTKVDKLLDALPEGDGRTLRGRIAIANAKIAYEEYQHIIASDRWKRLASAGARPQRLLWASTSPKDPTYADLHYIDELIGSATVDTMTPGSFRGFLDHGHPAITLSRDLARAHFDVEALAKLGISLDEVTEQLEDDGVVSFAASYDKALDSIGKKRRPAEAYASH
jgi:transaldolase